MQSAGAVKQRAECAVKPGGSVNCRRKAEAELLCDLADGYGAGKAAVTLRGTGEGGFYGRRSEK